MRRLLKKGAEASIYLDCSRIIKERTPKRYRLRELDQEIRKARTRKEAKLLQSSAVNLPKVYSVSDKSAEIVMEYISGELVGDAFGKFNKRIRDSICKDIGRQISRLHKDKIIHGDLTPSNLIIKGKDIYFIDFGLGFFSTKAEDRAVDLYLLKQTLKSMYQDYEEYFSNILEGYNKNNESEEVVERLKKVEKRGRYKTKGS